MPHIIDVSQSVEQDHPHALEFLRHDIQNLMTFFEKFGVEMMNIRQTFAYITNKELLFKSSDPACEDWLDTDPSEDAYLTEQISRAAKSIDTMEDNVFQQIFIPQSLYDFHDPEKTSGAQPSDHLNVRFAFFCILMLGIDAPTSFYRRRRE